MWPSGGKQRKEIPSDELKETTIWTDNDGRRRTISFEKMLGGLVFVENDVEANGSTSKQALVFSQSPNSWLSPVNAHAKSEETPLPEAVVTWMARTLQQHDYIARASFAQKIFAPWLMSMFQREPL